MQCLPDPVGGQLASLNAPPHRTTPPIASNESNRSTVSTIHSIRASAKRVIVTREIPAPAEAMLREAEAAGEISLQIHNSELPPSHDELVALAGENGGCDAIYCLLTDKVDQAVLDAAGDKLKVVSTMSVGYSHIDVAECTKRGISVGYTPDALTETVADLAVGLALDISRKTHEAAAAVKAGKWSTWKPLWLAGTDLHSTTVGIVGMGRIGLAIARRLANGFRCKIAYTGGRGRKPAAEEELNGGATYFEDVGDMFATCDFVMIACALTPATTKLVNAELLARMKASSFLVNVARGEVVDQEALIECLQRRGIAGAALDVTTPEPVPMDSPLLKLDNCIVLPHIGSASVATRNEIAVMASANLLAGLRGQAIPDLVPGSVSPAGAAAAE